MTKARLLKKFKDEVCNAVKPIDPHGEFHWLDLSIGFFLAHGVSIKVARNLAAKVRYDYNYWVIEEEEE